MANEPSAVQTETFAGKYLTFELAGEIYGLEILKVREIIGMMNVTPVPRTPAFIKGVVNLRGKVIPVTDLRVKFKMPAAERTRHTCIIVVDVGRLEMGIVVDSVSEVMDIGAGEIEATPDFGPQIETRFILGMGKRSERVTILLDIKHILTEDELGALQEMKTNPMA